MKRILLALAVLLAVSFTAQAQVKIGLKGGLNSSTLNGDNSGLESKLSFHAGAMVRLNLLVFKLQPELLYTRWGAQLEDNSDDKLLLEYVQIPVMFQKSFLDIAYVEAGPYLGLLVGADADGTDVSDSYNSTDFGAAVGAGVNLKVITINARYNFGISNIWDGGGDITQRNSALQISIGKYLFP